VATARTIRTKRRCCGSKPRCKRCPVVAKRLVKGGYAEPIEGRVFLVQAPKKALRKARKR
jgi:hypothetical protein